MATIPIASLRGVNPAQTPNRVDSQGAGAAFAGLAQLGSGIAQVGDTLSRIAIDRQMHVNKGILANEDIIRQNTFAEVEKFAAENKGSPETWDAFAKEKWAEYEDGRQQRMQAEGWGPAVKEQDTLDMQQFSARANRLFDAQKNKALVRQSNARMDSLAQRYADNGDFQMAAQVIRQTDRYDDEKNTMIDRVIDQGFRNQYSQRVADIATLSPAKQSEQAEALFNELFTRDDKGEYSAGVVMEGDERLGGMSAETRTAFIAQAKQIKARATNAMIATVERSIIPLYASANPDRANSIALEFLDRGEIDSLTLALFEGTINISQDGETGERRLTLGSGPISRAAKDYRNEVINREEMISAKQAEAERKKAIELDNAYTSAQEKVDKGTMTTAELDRLVERGLLRPEGANMLKEQLESQGAMMGITPASISPETTVQFLKSIGMKAGEANKTGEALSAINDYATRAAVAGRNITMEEFRTMVSSIQTLPGIGAEQKGVLMRQFINSLKTDFAAEGTRESYTQDNLQQATGREGFGQLIGMAFSNAATVMSENQVGLSGRGVFYSGKGGRLITEPEKLVRDNVYNKLLSPDAFALPPSMVGNLLIGLEEQIRSGYDRINEMPTGSVAELKAKEDAAAALDAVVKTRMNLAIAGQYVPVDNR